MNRPPKDAQHLGEGCYASFDGWQIRLWAERENGWHCVAFGPTNNWSPLHTYASCRGREMTVNARLDEHAVQAGPFRFSVHMLTVLEN